MTDFEIVAELGELIPWMKTLEQWLEYRKNHQMVTEEVQEELLAIQSRIKFLNANLYQEKP